LDPEKATHARAVLTTKPRGTEVTFSLLNPVAPVDAILLDDGSLVTCDNWSRMGYGKVLVFYEPTGNVRWSYELKELLSEERLRGVRLTISSIWWRKQPFEWQLESAQDTTQSILLRLWNDDQLRVYISDGRLEYIPLEGEQGAR